MLNYEEFYDYIWYQYVSTKIVPRKFQEANKSFLQEITFNYFHVYERLGIIHESIFAKLLETTVATILRSDFCIEDDYYDYEVEEDIDEDDFNDAALNFYDV